MREEFWISRTEPADDDCIGCFETEHTAVLGHAHELVEFQIRWCEPNPLEIKKRSDVTPVPEDVGEMDVCVDGGPLLVEEGIDTPEIVDLARRFVDQAPIDVGPSCARSREPQRTLDWKGIQIRPRDDLGVVKGAGGSGGDRRGQLWRGMPIVQMLDDLRQLPNGTPPLARPHL